MSIKFCFCFSSFSYCLFLPHFVTQIIGTAKENPARSIAVHTLVCTGTRHSDLDLKEWASRLNDIHGKSMVLLNGCCHSVSCRTGWTCWTNLTMFWSGAAKPIVHGSWRVTWMAMRLTSTCYWPCCSSRRCSSSRASHDISTVPWIILQRFFRRMTWLLCLLSSTCFICSGMCCHYVLMSFSTRSVVNMSESELYLFLHYWSGTRAN